MSLTSGHIADRTGAHRPSVGRSGPEILASRVFFGWLTAVVIVGGVVIGYFGRRVFLWSDDYVFLPDARKVPLDLDLLTTPLFGHFSPVSQFGDSLVAANLPTKPWLIQVVLLLLAIAVICAVAFLMVSLFGRTWLALIGTALAGPSLGLLPLVNWWTAGLNIMPAMVGFALCLGSVARFVRPGRGRDDRRWGALAIGGYLLAVLSWELGITAVGYALLWTILFRHRVTDEPWRDLARRTRWVWIPLVVIAALSLLNYRLNYYVATPSASVGQTVEALSTSLFTIQLPFTLGFFDPGRPVFRGLGIAVGIVLFGVLAAVTIRRSPRAWRGWAFALLGWLIPVAAVAISRVGYIGVRAVEQPMYYYLPTLLFVVGVLEAWAAPRRPGPVGSTAFRPPRWSQVVAVLAVATAFTVVWVASAWPTISSTNYGMIAGPNAPERDYMTNLVASAHELQSTGEHFSVINGVAPEVILNFRGHNRLSQLTDLHDPTITFDAPDGPWYAPDASGTLVPAVPQWTAELDLTSPFAALTADGHDLSGAGISRTPTGAGFCFTVDDPAAVLRWDLPTPATGGPLVIRTMATVDSATPVRVSTATNPADEPIVTNVNPRTWVAGAAGRLDTTPEPQIAAVVIDSMAVGTSMCLDSIQVGTVATG